MDKEMLKKEQDTTKELTAAEVAIKLMDTLKQASSLYKSEQEIATMIKSMFWENEPKTKKESYSTPIAAEETKESLCDQMKWKLEDLKRLSELSYLIEKELPELKDHFEKVYQKQVKEIKDLFEKYKGLRKSEDMNADFSKFMIQAIEIMEKKQGVPEGVDPDKQESCVKDVKSQGHDKVSAIKICNSSLQKFMKKKEEKRAAKKAK
jgi:hypothetical protein